MTNQKISASSALELLRAGNLDKRLLIKLNVEEEIENWLSVSDIDLDALVSELLTGFYRSSKIIKR